MEILPTLATNSVDLIVTDPPYMVNVNTNINGKANPWADMVNASFWFSAWMSQCYRILKQDGALWSFMNWKSLPIYMKSSLDLSWGIDSVLIWDKEWIGPGGTKGLRPSYEMVALLPKEKFSISDRGIPDIKRCKWSSYKPNGHPAEKPEKLMKWIVEISTDNNTILDPFMGSGTTGVACVQTGRNFIGIEIEPKYYETAEKRIKEAQMQLRLGI